MSSSNRSENDDEEIENNTNTFDSYYYNPEEFIYDYD